MTAGRLKAATSFVFAALAMLALTTLSASPAAAQSEAPVFKGGPSAPSYGPDDTDCEIYGHWESNWIRAPQDPITVTPEAFGSPDGILGWAVPNLKMKHFEAWPIGKIGFYGLPEGCQDDCEYFFTLRIVPSNFYGCVLLLRGYRGVLRGYVDEDEGTGDAPYILNRGKPSM